MDEVEVDVVDLQLAQALFEGVGDVVNALGDVICYKEFVPGHTRLLDGNTDLFFGAAVHFGAVEMPEPTLDGAVLIRSTRRWSKPAAALYQAAPVPKADSVVCSFHQLEYWMGLSGAVTVRDLYGSVPEVAMNMIGIWPTRA